MIISVTRSKLCMIPRLSCVFKTVQTFQSSTDKNCPKTIGLIDDAWIVPGYYCNIIVVSTQLWHIVRAIGYFHTDGCWFHSWAKNQHNQVVEPCQTTKHFIDYSPINFLFSISMFFSPTQFCSPRVWWPVNFSINRLDRLTTNRCFSSTVKGKLKVNWR